MPKCALRKFGQGAHRLRPLGPVLLPGCFRLHVIIINRRVPPDGRAKLAVAAAAGDAPRLDIRGDALMAGPVPKWDPAAKPCYCIQARGQVLSAKA